MPKTEIFHRASLTRTIRLKTNFNPRFFVLLSLIFLLQPFSFASLQKSLAWIDSKSSFCQAILTEKTPHNQHQYIDQAVDVETVEEDEVQHTHEEYWTCANRLITFKERHYTSYINIRYLRLAYSIHHKAEPALFVLYHSWKDYLA